MATTRVREVAHLVPSGSSDRPRPVDGGGVRDFDGAPWIVLAQDASTGRWGGTPHRYPRRPYEHDLARDGLPVGEYRIRPLDDYGRPVDQYECAIQVTESARAAAESAPEWLPAPPLPPSPTAHLPGPPPQTSPTAPSELDRMIAMQRAQIDAQQARDDRERADRRDREDRDRADRDDRDIKERKEKVDREDRDRADRAERADRDARRTETLVKLIGAIAPLVTPLLAGRQQGSDVSERLMAMIAALIQRPSGGGADVAAIMNAVRLGMETAQVAGGGSKDDESSEVKDMMTLLMPLIASKLGGKPGAGPEGQPQTVAVSPAVLLQLIEQHPEIMEAAVVEHPEKFGSFIRAMAERNPDAAQKLLGSMG